MEAFSCFRILDNVSGLGRFDFLIDNMIERRYQLVGDKVNLLVTKSTCWLKVRSTVVGFRLMSKKGLLVFVVSRFKDFRFKIDVEKGCQFMIL